MSSLQISLEAPSSDLQTLEQTTHREKVCRSMMVSSSSHNLQTKQQSESFKQQQKLHGRAAVVLLLLGAYVLVGPLFLHSFLTSQLQESISAEVSILEQKTSSYSSKKPRQYSHTDSRKYRRHSDHPSSRVVRAVGRLRQAPCWKWPLSTMQYVSRRETRYITRSHGSIPRCYSSPIHQRHLPQRSRNGAQRMSTVGCGMRVSRTCHATRICGVGGGENRTRFLY